MKEVRGRTFGAIFADPRFEAGFGERLGVDVSSR
jgi:hypothetical protein